MKTLLHDMDIREEGREEAIRIFIETLREMSVDDEVIRLKLKDKYKLNEERIEKIMEKKNCN